MTTFSDTDIKQITQHGLTLDTIEQQLNNFVKGFPFANITRPATINDGIIKYNDDDIKKFIKIYESEKNNYTITKFVPASGAATRMFKDLFEFLTTGKSNPTTEKVVNNIKRFAFYNDLQKFLPQTPTAHDIISGILDTDKLNMGTLPKALIKFHKYPNESRTAAAEHLIEGAKYAESKGVVNIHFTLSPEHLEPFYKLMQEIVPQTEQKFNVKFNITTSTQNPATDTIAVNFDNTPFRDDNGKLVFRPAGHGALIENLNQIDSDIIFIKNIDNITTDKQKNDTIIYKKLIAGVLITIQKQLFEFMNQLNQNNFNESELRNFIKNTLNEPLPTENTPAQKYMQILNKPIRICGIVKNTGEPGGGPFWTRDINTDSDTLQIIESGQIAPEKREIMNTSTHFSPTDLVCGVRDWQGTKFDLTRFIDTSAGFISEKSLNGKPLRAMERPGLWNGSMAYWHTVFVETPNTTFTPVKKVSDLLFNEHTE